MTYEEHSGDSSTSTDARDCSTGSANINHGTTAMPKHIPFPESSHTSSEFLSELLMSAFTIGAAVVQLINIYRTNWWLPQSHTLHMVNIHHIDPYLQYIILLINTRRVIYCGLLQLVNGKNLTEYQKKLFGYVLKYGFGGFLNCVLGYLTVNLCKQHNCISIFYLTYPILVYLLIFGFQLEPFLRTKFEVHGVYINDLPVHSCSTNALQIRDEVEALRQDFNRRFKQLIFTSMLNAYYSCLVPCLVGTNVHFNVMGAAVHSVIVCLTAFSLCTVFLYPAKYSDTLHRATLHLGHWQRLDRDAATRMDWAPHLIATANASSWSKFMVYSQGTVVKHNGKIYRSHGLVTVAIPGDEGHARFYNRFHNPSIIYFTLATLQIAVIGLEIAILNCATVEWHFVLSISFVAFTSLGALFKLVRDYLISKHLYNAEINTSEFSSTFNNSN